MKYYLTGFFLLVTFITKAQFSDDFEDGDFTVDETWAGDAANFEVNEDKQLHLVAPAETDTSYLVVAATDMDDVVWDFWLNMDFNPSSGNNTRVYLVSDQANLKGSLNGYFILIGNTADEISLYRQTGTSITEILDGEDGTVDSSSPEVRIQVTRDALGNWEVFRDATGGYSFVSEGTVLDATYTSTNYFGVFCKYTSSRSDLFYFDDLGNPYVDGIAPTLISTAVVSDTELDLVFSEPLSLATAETISNYNIDLGIGNPITAGLDLIDPTIVHLTLGTALTNGTTYEIEVTNVEDLAGNPILSPATSSFLYFVPVPADANDVIFTEVFPDPNPIVGLPEVEYFEIYNRSAKTFDLAGWTVNDNSTTATLESYILPVNGYLLICSPGDGALFGVTNFLEVDGLPTLTNSSDDLVLKDASGLVLDSIRYSSDWYKDNDKDDGGWSIERKHLNSPCNNSSNWCASTNAAGGTPGAENSVYTDFDDTVLPFVTSHTINGNSEIVVTFSEPVDTLFPLTLNIAPEVTELTGEYLTEESYSISALTLEEEILYNLSFVGGQDCWGNPIENYNLSFQLPSTPEQGDIILNEIMFNPSTGGSDYLEIYNNSEKVVDVNRLFIANWDDDTISNFETIGSEQLLLLPGEYLTLTEDSTDVINDFPIYGIGRFVDTDLPTYPNDSGTVYLFREDSILLDYFHYDEDYHFALLNTEDGKALERITFAGGLNNSDNWHTASENVDWGTPGYLNSQSIMPNTVGDVSIDPQMFSPDSDGYNDVLTINFDLKDSDNILDIRIYDNQGRIIRILEDNYFIGQTGILTWDGINDDGEKAAIGTYIVLISVKNSAGEETVFKLVTVLAGQL